MFNFVLCKGCSVRAIIFSQEGQCDTHCLATQMQKSLQVNSIFLGTFAKYNYKAITQSVLVVYSGLRASSKYVEVNTNSLPSSNAVGIYDCQL